MAEDLDVELASVADISDRIGKGPRRRPPRLTAQDGQEGAMPVPDGLILGGTMAEQAQAILAAMVKNNDDAEQPHVFTRGRSLVRLVRDASRMRLEEMDRVQMIAHLDAQLPAPARLTKDGGWVPADYPAGAIDRVLAMASWPGIPPIETVIANPALAPSGRLIVEPGYHAEIRAWLKPPEGLRPVPTVPSATELALARRWILDELLVDFPFVDASSRAHTIALGLLPLVKPAIAGPTPLHLTTATTPGTGKSLLVQMIALATTGAYPDAWTPPKEDDEWRKQITASLRDSPQLILIDNVGRKLTSPSLASALTTTEWRCRLLGQSEQMTLPVTCGWAATANAPELSPEIARRSTRIKLDAREEMPWLRTSFKHLPLEPWVRTHRLDLLWAFLVLITHWVAVGRPAAPIKLGACPEWNAIIGGILEASGIPGFLDGIDDYQDVDLESAEWRDFVAVWQEELGRRVDGADVNDLRELAIKHNLIPAVLGDGNDRSQQSRLGRALTRKKDCIIAGFVVVIEKDRKKKTNVYRLVQQTGDDLV